MCLCLNMYSTLSWTLFQGTKLAPMMATMWSELDTAISAAEDTYEISTEWTDIADLNKVVTDVT